MIFSLGIRAVLFYVLSILVTSVSIADDFKPLTVAINESQSSTDKLYRYDVTTKIPNDRRLQKKPEVILDSNCQKTSLRNVTLTDFNVQRTEQYRCARSLYGSNIRLDFGSLKPAISTLILITAGSQYKVSAVLAPHQSDWQVPMPALSGGNNWLSTVHQYLVLGVKHFISGYDHLLFIACLLIICRGSWRSLLTTITAFTVAHSISLALSVFELISLNSRAVEAVIALSIVYLSCDIVRHLRNQNNPKYLPSLSYRYPSSIAFLFGLIHGLGFANILNEFGLPQNAKTLALLAFNIGIEAGQLLFVGVVLVLYLLLISVIKRIEFTTVGLLTAYLSGAVACFWTLQRVLIT